MKVYINNKLIETNISFTILQLCSKIGIEIPRFCYHPKLSIAANCRMCLVQIEGLIKPMASCSVGLSNKMKIYTNSRLVKKMRESVLEFLLINHPLDCPICDQGGECDLQDQTLIFGSDRGRFYEKKKAVNNFSSGPLIKTFMTRCIHCTRCIRFASEISREKFFGALGRGSQMKITNFLGITFQSPLSGNVIDICPVGALNSKPYSFTARSWELKSVFSVDISDYFFSKIRVDCRGNEIMRVIPGYQDSYQTDWISDKARFFFDGLKHQRLVGVHSRIIEKLTWKESLMFFSYNFAYFFMNNDVLTKIFSTEVENILVKTSLFIKKKNIFFLQKNGLNLISFQKAELLDEVVYFNKLFFSKNSLYSISTFTFSKKNLFINLLGTLKILMNFNCKITIKSGLQLILLNIYNKKDNFFTF